MKTKESSSHLLWYDKPAESWHEALPLGNGRLGAMVFGGIGLEKIMINEDTLVSGAPGQKLFPEALETLPEVRQLIMSRQYARAEKLLEEKMLSSHSGSSYQPAGDLLIQIEGDGPTTNYTRSLNLNTAIAKVEYQRDGFTVTRECFVSYRDQLIILKISTDKPTGLRLTASLSSPLNHQVGKENHKSVILRGNAPGNTGTSDGDPSHVVEYSSEKGMKYEMYLSLEVDSGNIEYHGNRIAVDRGNGIIIKLAVETSFNGYNKDPLLNGKDPGAICRARLEAIENTDVSTMLKRHSDDHKMLYNRTKLHLTQSIDTGKIPTDQRILQYRNGQDDPALEALFFHYGRYLLIASSRKGSQPANLQGIWNESVRPPWSGNLTTNINLQMNYWPAEVCNLAECHEPLFRLISELQHTGSAVASAHYGTRGFAVHHGVDIWRSAAPAGGKASWSFWPMAGPWLCQHLWEHYAFGEDKEFLKATAYPLMKESALFCLDWLIENDDGTLITCPSTSPENSFITKNGDICAVTRGSTMDMALIRELYTNCLNAAEILETSDDFTGELKQALPRLSPFKVGKHGQLQEWYDDFEEADPGHRHIAQIYPLHPGYQITPEKTPDLIRACEVTMDRRLAHEGKDTIGWCYAWNVNIFARLRRGDRAYNYFSKLVANAFPNMLNAHRHPRIHWIPMPLEANYGGTAGVAEMLLQSHDGTLDFLPALPPSWASGKIMGLRGRGGFAVTIEWEKGIIKQAVLQSEKGNQCFIRCRKIRDLTVKSEGSPIMVTQTENIFGFQTNAGKSYEISPVQSLQKDNKK